MAAVMCQVFKQFYKKCCEKALFISLSVKDYRSYILTDEYVVASHNSFCPLRPVDITLFSFLPPLKTCFKN